MRKMSLLGNLAYRAKPILLPIHNTWTAFNEKILGIDTVHPPLGWDAHPDTGKNERSHVPADSMFGDRFTYEAMDYRDIYRIINRLVLKEDDVFYDLGCGKGRVLCVMARKKISRCIGIEIDPELVKIARGNAQRLRGRRAAIEVRCLDVAHADLDEGTIYFMYNPFGEKTLCTVLNTIEQSLNRRPRAITLIYYNPTMDHVMICYDWLTVQYRWRNILGYETVIMRNAPLPKLANLRTEVDGQASR